MITFHKIFQYLKEFALDKLFYVYILFLGYCLSFFLYIRETLDKYSLELVKVSKCLLKLMAKNLAINPEQFANMFEDGRQSLRMNYYPPCEQASKVLGLTPHSDFGGLTLLVQVNEVQGLQIKRNGKWIPIRPLPGAFIVNIGDVIEVITTKLPIKSCISILCEIKSLQLCNPFSVSFLYRY